MFKSIVPGSILIYKQYNIFQRLWAKLTNKELKYNRAILFPSNIELMNTLSRYSEAILLEPKKSYNKAEQSIMKLEIEKLTDENELYTVEFKNKGINVYLESLNRLTRDKNLKKEVLAFINVPGWVGEAREDLLERLSSDKTYDMPLEVPFITHWLHNMTHDQVLDMLKYLNMSNAADTKVKVIFVPCYLDGKDGILNESYYDLLIGMDLSVYPSYYEPWGYTPLESVAFHVPTITTDLAGFGLWVNSVVNHSGTLQDGVKVIHRTDYNYSEVADSIKDTVTEFSALSNQAIENIREHAAIIAEKALWKHFIQYYYEAYDVALRNARQRLSQSNDNN